MITKCEETDNEIAVLKEEADELTDYAVVVRYPDDWFVPDLEEAKGAFEIANKIREFVLNKI